MGTIFVAYGQEPYRETVLEFAAKRAAAAADDLFVYHIHEVNDQSTEQMRGEIEAVIQRTAPDVDFEITIGLPEHLDPQESKYERSTVSPRKQLLDAITATDRDYEYVVMGNIEHGPVEEFFLTSMTEAVLDTYEIPVMLVPVTED